jgi:hypothetical protein
MQIGTRCTAIRHADLDQDVFRRLLSVFDEYVEIAVLIEDSCVDQLVFRLKAADAVLLDELVVGIG